MKIEKIIFIYLVVLGLIVFFCAQLPTRMSSYVNFFLPGREELTSFWNIRYRMSLFISATITFICFIPFIASVGFYGEDISRIRTLRWFYIAFIVFAVPVGWLIFPLVALCSVCWTSNDYFYFFITVSFFTTLQILVQVFILKIRTTLWRFK